VYRFGGAGGFTRATVTVTPGETLTIVVGGAGVRNTTVSALGAAAYGGGGAPRSGSVLCAVGGGGGYTGVFRGAPAQGTALAIAGGGGGASGYSHGGTGTDVANSGGASALAGANGSGDWVGGGGGGYVGGSLHTRSTSNATWPSGNGGRGFTASGAVYDVSMLSTPEFSRVPPALSEPGYPGLGSFGAAAVGYGGRGADTGLNCNDAGHGGAYLTW
jgi:hypothetical protein